MLVWGTFWYPFNYFVFPENLSTDLERLLSISREYIRMLPAVFFIFYYSKQINLDFKNLFSFKFNYKVFSIVFSIFAFDLLVVSFFKHGNIYFDFQKMQFYDAILWLSLGLCQELVFRGWSFHAFKSITSQKNAIIFSSFFFAASHWFAHFFRFYTGKFDLSDFISVTAFTFLFGVVMCLILIKTKSKSIIPLSILHAFWDFMADAIL